MLQGNDLHQICTVTTTNHASPSAKPKIRITEAQDFMATKPKLALPKPITIPWYSRPNTHITELLPQTHCHIILSTCPTAE